MANVRPILNRVWEILRQAGIDNDLEIIEYIAALLTEDMPSWPFPPEQRPQKTRRYNPDDTSLKNLLGIAAGEIDEKDTQRGRAILFNRHVLFQSSKPFEPGSYPTPRHIIEFMYNLLQVRPSDTFADFACGSGGFLVQRYTNLTSKQPNTKGQTIGIEISPALVRIASANLALQGLTKDQVQIHSGDALRLLSNTGTFAQEQFDRVAISPPLDILLEAPDNYAPPLGSIPTHWHDTGDIIFALLLYAKLKSGGRGATIVLGHVLSHLTESAPMRAELARRQEIQAVISLGNDVLSPFFSKSAYVFILEKTKQVPPHPFVWFLQAGRDGYTWSRDRDLGNDPSIAPHDNDLPFIQAVLRLKGDEVDFRQSNEEQIVTYKFIKRGRELLGVVLKLYEYASIVYTRFNNRRSLTIKKNLSDTDVTISTIQLSASTTFVSERNNRLLIADGRPGQLVAISYRGRLIGTTQTTDQIVAKHYDLLPETYLRLNERILTDVSTGARLPDALSLTTDVQETVTADGDQHAQIQTPSQETTQNLIASPPSIVSLPKPYQPAPFSLLNVLGATQQKVWDTIQQLEPNGRYALYFTAEQLQAKLGIHEIQSTLNLLEHLGLITRVTFSHLGAGHAIPHYRRITDADRPPDVSHAGVVSEPTSDENKSATSRENK